MYDSTVFCGTVGGGTVGLSVLQNSRWWFSRIDCITVDRLHYPAYYTATCQNENITSHGVSFFNLFVTSILSVDQQRNNLSAKTVMSLSNGRRWA